LGFNVGAAVLYQNCNSYTTTDTTVCETYTSPIGNVYTTSTTIVETIPNASGCDSVMTINLTVNQSNTGVDVISACNSYTWIDGNTYTSSNNTATHNLTNAVGCDSLVTLNLTINSVNTTTIISGSTITADATGAAYQWLDCDNNYSVLNGETNQSFTAISNGNYAVELTENSCIDTSACVSITTILIDELSSIAIAYVYPNPSSEIVHVTFQETVNNVELTLTDLQGKIISKQTYSSLDSTSIKLKGSKGVYFLTIKTSEGKNTIKLIKE